MQIIQLETQVEKLPLTGERPWVELKLQGTSKYLTPNLTFYDIRFLLFYLLHIPSGGPLTPSRLSPGRLFEDASLETVLYLAVKEKHV